MSFATRILVPLLLASSVTVLQLPYLTSSQELRGILLVLAWLPLILFSAIILVADPLLFRGGRQRIIYLLRMARERKFGSALLAIFIILLMIAYVRSAAIGTISAESAIVGIIGVSVSLLFSVAIASRYRSAATFGNMLNAMLFAFPVYVFINLFLYFSGVRNYQFPEGVGDANLLAMFGIGLQRIALPTATGINSFGPIAGATFLIGLVWLSMNGKAYLRVTGVLAAVVGVVAIFLIDSRGALGFSIISAIVFYIAPKSLWEKLHLAPALSLVIPILLIIVVEMLPDLELFQLIARTEDSGVVSSRDLVWASAMAELINYSPIHLFGFGTFGQATSGISADYAAAFASDFEHSSLASLHNFALQYVFDIGYFGLVIFLALAMYAIKQYTSSRNAGCRIVAIFLTYIVLVGSIEAVPTVYSRDTFFVFTFFVGLAIFGPRDNISLKYPNTKVPTV